MFKRFLRTPTEQIKTPPIFWIDAIEPLRMAVMPRPPGGNELTAAMEFYRSLGVRRIVSLLEPAEARRLGLEQEAALCDALGMQFVNHPIIDHGVPGDRAAFTAFVDENARAIASGTATAVHCLAGLGRSPLTCACIMLRLGHDMGSAFPDITRARGSRVPEMTEQALWFRDFATSAETAAR